MIRCCWRCGARAIGRSAAPSRRRTLVDKDGFAGVDGSFRFDRDGIAERLLEVRQVSAGGHQRRVAGGQPLSRRRFRPGSSSSSRRPAAVVRRTRAVAFEQAVAGEAIDRRDRRRCGRRRAARPARQARCPSASRRPMTSASWAASSRVSASSSTRPWPLRATAGEEILRLLVANGAHPECGGHGRQARRRHNPGSASRRGCGGFRHLAGRGWRFHRPEGRPPRCVPGSARTALRKCQDRAVRTHASRPSSRSVCPARSSAGRATDARCRARARDRATRTSDASVSPGKA